jgi:hypothetical protein
VDYFLLTTFLAPFFLAPFIVATFFVAALLTLRVDATLLFLVPAAKSPIAATVTGSVATSEDGCDRCRVLNPTDSKGNSTSFVSVNVCDAAGMGGLGRNRLGWALSSIRLRCSGLGCALGVRWI